MSTATLTTSRDPKGQKFIATVAAAYDKAGLDDERAQLLNESSEFVPGFRQLIEQCSAMNEFADEEVPSTYGYLSGYTRPLQLPEQVQRLRDLFPELANSTFDESIATRELPAGAEGYFAIPLWQKIARAYGEAVQKVLDTIEQTHDGKFYNYQKGQLGPKFLRLHARTVEKFQHLAEQQKGHDILVVSAQFGVRHRGRSVRRAREIMTASEFGSGAFHTGIMLLTHPYRLQHFDDLRLDCPSDEFSVDGDGVFDRAPYFYFYDGKVEFGTDYVGHAVEDYGSVSLFLPQN